MAQTIAFPDLMPRGMRRVTWTPTTWKNRFGVTFEAVEISYDVLRQDWSTNELKVALIAAGAPSFAYDRQPHHATVLTDESLLLLGEKISEG